MHKSPGTPFGKKQCTDVGHHVISNYPLLTG